MNNPHVVMVKQILAFVLQACMYLYAKNADVEENEELKSIAPVLVNDTDDDTPVVVHNK